MPLTTTTVGALVSGASPTETTMTTIRALRSFYLSGEVVPAGGIVTASDAVARELIAANKAVAVANGVVSVAESPEPHKPRKKRGKE
jgi:hypothetical protein